MINYIEYLITCCEINLISYEMFDICGKLQVFFYIIKDQRELYGNELLFQGIKLKYFELEDNGDFNFKTLSLSFRRSASTAASAITNGF